MDAGLTYGRGVAFTVGLSPFGRVAFSEGPQNIVESLTIILSTEPGERLMRPAFGAGLREFLFEPNTPATHRLIEDRVRGSIERWEPRVKLESVVVAADREEPAAASVAVRYRLVATDEPGQLAVAVPVAAGATIRTGGAA